MWHRVAVELGLLGPLRVRSSGQDIHITPGRQRTLLAVLALRANSVVSADELVEQLWDTAPPAKAKAALHVQMARLRRALGRPDPIRTVPAGYSLSAAPGAVDVQRFESLVRAADGATDLAVRSRHLTEALALWRGPALVDVPGEALQRDVVPALMESRAQALEQRIDVDLSLGRHAALISELRTLTGEHPLRERFWGQLMIALYRSEQQAEALRTYRTARRLLIDVLGVEPGPELRRLEQDVLAGVPQLRQSPPAVRLDSWEPQYQLPREVTGVVGFERYADALADQLTKEASVPVVAIQGGAGVGKSTLAVQVAHRTRQSFPDGQWFVRLEGAERGGRPPVDVLGELLIASGVSGPMIPRGVAARAAMLRARLAGRRVLLLLDDAAGPEQVEDLIPGTEGSAVLTTSRRDLRGLSVRHGTFGLELPVLTAAAGAALLTTVLGSARTAAEPDAVAELVELCARLPLAIRIAAANLGLHPDRSIAAAVAELRGGDRLSRLQVAGDAAVRAAFDVSYRGLDPMAARTFRLLGLVPGPDFTAETAAVLLDVPEADAERRLEVLAATSLIQHHRPGRYQFHDLLRLYAAEQANTVEGATASAATVHRLITHQVARIDRAAALLYPNTRRLPRPAVDVPGFADHGEALAWLDAERASLVAAARHVAVEGPIEQAWHLADALRGYFAARRHNDDWEALASTGLAAAEASGSVDVLAAMHLSLGVLHSYRAEHSPAEAHYRQAIALRQAAGKNDENGPVYNNLGVLYTSQAMYGDAVEALRQAAALDRALCSPGGLANKLSNLATVLFYQGELAAAVEQLRECERIRAAAGIPPTAQTTFTLGQCLHRLGDSSAAVEELTRSLTISQEIGDNLSVAYAHYGLAEVGVGLDDLDQAADHAAAALALAREMRSPATEIDALNVCGTVQRRRSDHLQAIALHTRALDLSRQAGERRAGVQAQVGLAAALSESGQLAAATDQATAALETARRYGLRIAEATALALLSRLHSAAGDGQAAASAAQQATELHRLTGYHPPGWEIAWLADA